MIKRITIDNIAAWLKGGDNGHEWKTCNDCNGSGYYLTADHETEGYIESPGYNEGGMTEANGYYNVRSHWCRTCRGMGRYYYNDDGLLIPGRGDEFDQPAPSGPVDYKTYMQSREWRDRANIVKAHAGWRCKICNRHENEVTLDAHHNTYDRLGHERLSDLICLCRDCHKIADVQRANQARREKAFKTYAEKRWGEDWPDVVDEDEAYTQFEEWLDRKGVQL